MFLRFKPVLSLVNKYIHVLSLLKIYMDSRVLSTFRQIKVSWIDRSNLVVTSIILTNLWPSFNISHFIVRHDFVFGSRHQIHVSR